MRFLLFINFLVSFSFVHSQTNNPDIIKILANQKASSITYTMSHPMHDWDGVSKDLKAIILYNKEKQSIENVAVSVKVVTFDSQNANRDSHMIEVVDGIKYPGITFSSTSVKQEANKLSVLGNLTFHGVTKPVSFDAITETKGKTMVVTGGFTVLMTAYNIEKPSLMGMPTSDVIKLNFNIEFDL